MSQEVNTTDVNTCDLILIGLGANLPSDVGGPVETLTAALAEMARAGIVITLRSPWYRSQPVPVSDQDWFVNGVVAVETSLEPGPLLGVLHDIEAGFGRRRAVRNEARPLDLDLLAYGARVADDATLQLPHPRLQMRAFVLEPLADIAPDWRHPVSGATLDAMRCALPPGQVIEKMS